ncbi:efflux RND transporter permease subunit [Aestuariibacter sp. GS-14]|uniref:efflux RND transporter permease subunit n=1 Tax=Aestuariibacter sp. GS-14 TaxID=2590670 RepID=UPI00112D9F2F|nr:CusA/CzcA family heavy metal efflux RND transporter [Aestuariibacter sp. GS-14]TPV52917.1 efflux RND transporter permease subunit [Aestuariibacter sp. GS-14]
MIAHIIRWSIANRVLVLIATLMLGAAGVWSVKQTPVDAIPDLSDVQVIIKTSYPGQAPSVVEQQVTYPLTTAMLSVPGAHTVRGFSFFGDSYVYILFDDSTDIYWARSRVLEYLSQVAPTLPDTATPQLGPDATGVGWVYIYALSDPTGKLDIAGLTSLQDWFLKYELQTVPGVAEVATVGGMKKQYQVVIDPLRLQAYNLPLSSIERAITRGNQEVGASVVEMAEAEYMVTVTGYLQSQDDLRQVVLGATPDGTPVLLSDVAEIRLGPAARRGIAELNGEGETVGGIIVMRYGENAEKTIAGVKSALQRLQTGLPDGVTLTTVYDRSNLITKAVDNLWDKLIEELVIVALVCGLFLLHLRSAIVALVTLPLGILAAFILMHLQGLNANIMSLGGIAIAIGAMTDGAIVLIENFHKHLEDPANRDRDRWELVAEAAGEVGPALFFSLLIITVSFLPVFILEAQEGRMFAPLAYTKTYAMAAAAGLAITLIPVLIGYFIRGNIMPEAKNPVNRAVQAIYQPALQTVLRFPKSTVTAALLLGVIGFYPVTKLGSEFMPPLDEGDLMYMPTTYAGVSIGEARQILQQTDKLIRTMPEVQTVFGKVGRAETATDPAPLTMIETFIQLKPQSEWREGVTTDSLKAEFDALVQFPGLTNAWVMPIKTRIDMLATGIKTPLGLKISGPDITVIEQLGKDVERILGDLPGTASVYAERVAGARYITLDVNRYAAARYGMNIADVQQVISTAVGGKKVTTTVEGLERYSVNMRYPQTYRDSPEAMADLPLITPNGQRITLGDVADINITQGPPALKSENARLTGYTFIDLTTSDIQTYVANAKSALDAHLTLPAGYSLKWAGQYEYMERAKQKLTYVLPLTLAIIVILLFMSFRNMVDVAIVLGTLPLGLIGGFWLLYWLDYQLSVAVGVGFIALAGVTVEIGVIMVVYLNDACKTLARHHALITTDLLRDAVAEGALKRVRPVLMTVATVMIGLLPVMAGTGTGSEVMSRIATPMVGGMASALVLSLLVIPACFYLVQVRRMAKQLAK